MKKGNRFERICPTCRKEKLKYLSDHLSIVHVLNSSERKPYIAIAKYQGITVYDAELPIPKIKPIATKAKNRTLKYNVKQSVKRIKANQWSKYPYPEFRFEHLFSIMVVGRTSCGTTFSVMILLESHQMKDFDIEWYYNQYQHSYDQFSARIVHTYM